MDQEMLAIFEQFMQAKFPHMSTEDSYYDEWRKRFEMGFEWQKSDYNGRAILKSIAPNVYPDDKDEFFMREI